MNKITSKACTIGLLALFTGCSSEEPAAAKYRKQIASLEAKPNEEKNADLGEDIKETITLREAIYSEDFGLDENENIDGKSLFEILTSQEAGRDDGQVCSACHNRNDSQGGYGVDSASEEALDEIDPDAEISGRSWTEDGGWAERFVENDTKPANVRAVIQAWIDGGYQE